METDNTFASVATCGDERGWRYIIGHQTPRMAVMLQSSVPSAVRFKNIL